MIRSRGRRALLSTICAFALFLTCSTAEYTQANITNPPGFKLLPGISSVPAPVRVAPDDTWMGIDGSWNTFSIRLGSPQEKLQVLISTASEQIWTIYPQACIANITDPNTNKTQYNAFSTDCETSRGHLFNTSQSKTWHQKGYFQLSLERRLDIVGNGLYGFDSVGLGLEGEEGPSVQNATISTMITPNFWLGHIGLDPKPTNFSIVEDPVPSYLMNLFSQKNIPSLSFGYTAGAKYHSQTVLSSLTLGGYDASRIIRNDLTFIFAPDSDRDLVVGVVGLTADTSTTRNINLLKRDGVDMFIDSSIAELWLPIEICKAFEDTFGLKYDNTTDLYLVDDALHKSLLVQNPNITFTLGQKFSTQTTLEITLPYGAFDLQASPPYQGLKTKTNYFPIRRGDNSSQWVLGRTFLQEAYLTVDWERSNFSLSAINWAFGKPANLLPIVSPTYAVPQYIPPKGPGLATGVIVGLAVGCSLIFALVVCAVGLYFWRRRNKRKLDAIKAKYEANAAPKKNISDNSDDPPKSPEQDKGDGTIVFRKAELPDSSTTHHELSDEKDPLHVNEVDSTEPQIHEMLGDIPKPQEAGGRQLSEKESMVVRERIYNGTDPNSPTDVASTAQAPSRQLAPITASEITIVSPDGSTINNTTMSPVSPRTPSARDGAFLEANDTFFQLPPYRPAPEGRPPDETLLSPISPLEGSGDCSRRRFSYES